MVTLLGAEGIDTSTSRGISAQVALEHLWTSTPDQIPTPTSTFYAAERSIIVVLAPQHQYRCKSPILARGLTIIYRYSLRYSIFLHHKSVARGILFGGRDSCAEGDFHSRSWLSNILRCR